MYEPPPLALRALFLTSRQWHKQIFSTTSLKAAAELNKRGFARGAGAIAGVVLEGHLATMCNNRSVSIAKKKPTPSDFYQALKSAKLIDQATWRFIQHLGDIRNSCDHKGKDPTKESVDDLIAGVRKISKTVL